MEGAESVEMPCRRKDLVWMDYPRNETVQTVREGLRVSPHDSLPLPTAGWVVEEVEQGPALLPPPGRGGVAEETHHMETARSVPPTVDRQDFVHPEVSLEEWSEYTVRHLV